MVKSTVEAGEQIGAGPNFWSRLNAGVYTIVQLIAWGPDGTETIVDDVDGQRLPVAAHVPTFTVLTGGLAQLAGGTANIAAAPDSGSRWVQNLDQGPLELVFEGGAVMILPPSPGQGAPGGDGGTWSSDSFKGSITLSSAIQAHQYAYSNG